MRKNNAVKFYRISILLLERLVELEYSLTLNIKFTSYMAMTKDRNNNNTNELL